MHFQKHGLSHSRIYLIYRDMKSRCYNPNKRVYPHYGGRGIKVCDTWLGEDGFARFYKWAMSHGYRDDLSIDRIDVNGNYSPKNCRWVDRSTQNANRRCQKSSGYIGVQKHLSGSGYYTMIKYQNKRVFWYYSRSKNDCARARNEYILSHNLPHPLNDIKEEYEDVIRPRNKHFYYAQDKKTGEYICGWNLSDFAHTLGLTRGFVGQCLHGKRNSAQYVFGMEPDYGID